MDWKIFMSEPSLYMNYYSENLHLQSTNQLAIKCSVCDNLSSVDLIEKRNLPLFKQQIKDKSKLC